MKVCEAFLDDYGKINVWVNKDYYGGVTNSFILYNRLGDDEVLPVDMIQHDTTGTFYTLRAPKGLDPREEYRICLAQGMTCALSARRIVKTEKFQKEFTYYGEDLGAQYTPTHTDFAVWAPTAVSVTLSLTSAKGNTSKAMERSEQGVWRVRVEGDLKNFGYVYLVERNGEIVKSLDPYALSGYPNSFASAVIDENDILSMPKVDPGKMITGTDAIIYETSVRDMTMNPLSGTRTHGKFSSLTQSGTTYKDLPTGLDYLSYLGITHVQLMPVLDFATVDEYHPQFMYNWGYDPEQYLSLEGSYSDEPEVPFARMKECREMVNAMHKRGLRVNLDVVFNHVYNYERCPFTGTLPYYFFRFNERGYLSNGSYCGNDFASEMPMARKYLVHVCRQLVRYYDIDGFRFDLMGILDTDTMNEIYQAVNEVKPGVMVYGEGWDMPTVLESSRKAGIMNQAKMDHIGHFNDYFRDVIKGKTSDSEVYDKGYATGDTSEAFLALAALTANVLGTPHNQRFDSPEKSINALETHDNHTVWDKMHMCCGNEDRTTRLKRMRMMMAITMAAQGVPFIHSGFEFAGTKNDNSNSYNAGDAINALDWERAYYNRELIEYTRKTIAIRKRFAGFRLKTKEQVGSLCNVWTGDNGMVFYDIRIREEGFDTLRIIINPGVEDKILHFEGPWYLLFNEDGEDCGAMNDYYMPGLTVFILGKKEEAHED